jgi:hypothetical protein
MGGVKLEAAASNTNTSSSSSSSSNNTNNSITNLTAPRKPPRGLLVSLRCKGWKVELVAVAVEAALRLVPSSPDGHQRRRLQPRLLVPPLRVALVAVAVAMVREVVVAAAAVTAAVVVALRRRGLSLLPPA